MTTPQELADRLEIYALNCEVDGMHQAALDLREAANVLRSFPDATGKVRLPRKLTGEMAQELSTHSRPHRGGAST